MASSKVEACLAHLCIPNNWPGTGKYSVIISQKRQEYLEEYSTLGGQFGVVAVRAAVTARIQ